MHYPNVVNMLPFSNNVSNDNSTFRMTSFDNNGFALKLSGFTDMYIFSNESTFKESKDIKQLKDEIFNDKTTGRQFFKYDFIHIIKDFKKSFINYKKQIYHYIIICIRIFNTQSQRIKLLNFLHVWEIINGLLVGKM